MTESMEVVYGCARRALLSIRRQMKFEADAASDDLVVRLHGPDDEPAPSHLDP